MRPQHRTRLADLLDAWIEFACRKVHSEYVQHGPLEGPDEALTFTVEFLEGSLWGAYVGGIGADDTDSLTDDLSEIEEMVAAKRERLRETLQELAETSAGEPWQTTDTDTAVGGPGPTDGPSGN